MKGNERALAAKLALDLTPDNFKIPYTDISRFIHSKWQKCWNNNIHNMLE